MHNTSVTVTRFSLYPVEEPTAYVVGFSVSHSPTQRTMYRDTLVPLTEVTNLTDSQVIDAAWDVLKEGIQVWVESCKGSHSLLGSTYVPHDWVPAPQAPENPETPVEEPMPQAPENPETPFEEPAPQAPENPETPFEEPAPQAPENPVAPV